MNNWKRISAVFLIMAMVLCTSVSIAFADASKAYTYRNPHDLIIQAPDLNYTTTAAKISIYGASDYDYPVYMNGTQIQTTELGFFAQYVTLNAGTNTFTFTNNDKQKTVTVTRKQAATRSGGKTNITIWGSASAPQYGTVTGHNISRMSSPGADDEALLMPLAKGTVAQLTGESGNLYRLSDGTFVYKSNVTVSKGTLGKAAVSEMAFQPLNSNNCTELSLKISKNALYNLEMKENWAILTIYNASHNAVLPEITQNKIIRSVEVLDNGDSGNTVYCLNFKDNAPINGYYVEFDNGSMNVGFKQRPMINSKDLTGVRIHVDAGHGGTDTGALGAAGIHGPLEKEINLSIALELQKYLESRGAVVTMTRTGDTAVGLSDRAYQVALEKPDLCISVHCNSMPVTTDYNNVKGLLTFYSFEQDPAIAINDGLASNLGIEKKAPRYKNLAMTRMTAFPSVLFETAFISNPADYEWLIKKSTQEQYGLAAGKSVEAYILQTGLPADVTVIIDGKKLVMDQPPVIENGRTLVPLRAIFEALGAEVEWDDTTKTAIAEKDGVQIQLSIGKTLMEVSGKETKTITLEVPAQLINERTMVPARAVSEALGAKVDWDGENRTVIIE